MVFFYAITLRAHCDQCHPSVMNLGTGSRIGRNVANLKSNFSVPASPMRVEVAVHTAHEQYPKSLTDQDVLYIGEGHPKHLCNKPRLLSFDEDVERNRATCRNESQSVKSPFDHP